MKSETFRNTTFRLAVLCLLLVPFAAAAQGPPRYEPIVNSTCGQCVFDTRTFDVGDATESITAYGRFWNFDVATGDPLPGNGTRLDEVGRYTDTGGPCLPGKLCTFDTRMIIPGGTSGVEVITAVFALDGTGRYWEYDVATGKLLDTNLLSQRDGSRYSAPDGPCVDHPADCRFDTLSVGESEGVWYETLTANYRRWRYQHTGGYGWQLLSVEDLAQVAEYWPAGACQDAPTGNMPPYVFCELDSMAHGLGAESITSYDKYWNYDFGSGTPWPGNGSCLVDVDRYSSAQAGPCMSCQDHHGDPAGCAAAPGCEYFTCSDQCHPEGTSPCDAGCTGIFC